MGSQEGLDSHSNEFGGWPADKNDDSGYVAVGMGASKDKGTTTEDDRFSTDGNADASA